ncbi:MAG: FAD-dependent oxidoreductase [Nocardioides sp.]|uniref:GMC family oxidoreductase n=1 Tax=Nocardioides sp. TaxID=35761 RepID=UPI0039E529C4
MLQTFDYVIVGGGTAGCVLAARLSEDPNLKVLLLEAGRTDRHPLVHVPAGFAKLTAGPWEWGLSTTPQAHLNDRRIPYAQGKVLGGGGSINAQVFTRGTPSDYDRWEAEHGAKGWAFEDVLPYFVKSEDNNRLSGRMHGTGGPLGVSDQINPSPLSRAFVKAGQEAGLPYNDDFNGERQEGVGFYQSTTRNGRRCSAAVGYLRPAASRPNLTVQCARLVLRVVVDDDRAIGVQVANGGSDSEFIRATREVIVAAGAIGSPKLLQLSGVGDPAALHRAGVEVQHALPGVGANLRDHCDLDVMYELKQPLGLDRYDRIHPRVGAAGLRYLTTRTGPLASTVVEAGAFSFAPEVDDQQSQPSLQFHFLPAAGVEAGIEALRPGYGVTLNSYFLRPRSRGSVSIRSADPELPPDIDPRYMANDYDLEMAIEGVRQSREIMAQPSMAQLVSREHLPGGDRVTSKDDYIRFVRSHGRTSYHPVGTCAMGTGEDAVVDARLSVIGLGGLRVADSSVMPDLISANTQAPTVMIAEKAADLIRMDE